MIHRVYAIMAATTPTPRKWRAWVYFRQGDGVAWRSRRQYSTREKALAIARTQRTRLEAEAREAKNGS